jgi:hypothetical protein
MIMSRFARGAGFTLLSTLLTFSGMHSAQADQTPQHRLTIDVTPQETWATGTDTPGIPGYPRVDGNLKVGKKLSYRIGPRLSVNVQQSYIDESIGRWTAPNGKPEGPGTVHDLVEDYYFAYPVHSLQLRAGFDYRHRVCCPAATSGAAPQAWHEYYLEGDYGFGPRTSFGSAFTLGLRASYMPHHASPAYLASLPPGVKDEGSRMKYSGFLNVTCPISRRHQLAAFATYAYDSDYFENSPIEFFYNDIDFGLTKVVNPHFSVTVKASNLTQFKQGYPFAYPNAIHRAQVLLLLDYHLTP